MNLRNISFLVPEEIIFTLNENINEFPNNIRLFSALQFYKMHKLSLGKAAELANIDKENFISQLGKHKIPLIDYNADELKKELSRFNK